MKSRPSEATTSWLSENTSHRQRRETRWVRPPSLRPSGPRFRADVSRGSPQRSCIHSCQPRRAPTLPSATPQAAEISIEVAMFLEATLGTWMEAREKRRGSQPFGHNSERTACPSLPGKEGAKEGEALGVAEPVHSEGQMRRMRVTPRESPTRRWSLRSQKTNAALRYGPARSTRTASCSLWLGALPSCESCSKTSSARGFMLPAGRAADWSNWKAFSKAVKGARDPHH